MSQHYLMVVCIMCSALLIIESTPLREDAVLRQSGSYALLAPPRTIAPPVCCRLKWPSTTQIFMVFFQVLLSGILAGVTLAVMSVDKTRLRIWTKTKGKKQREFAKRILKLRSRPNWLLVTLIIACVSVAESIPLSLNFMLRTGSAWLAFGLSTTSVILLGELVPHALVSVFVLEVGGRAFWFLKCLMWFLAVPACIPAYALRRFKRWRGRNQDEKEGLLEVDEMMEFLRLHQHSSGYGGTWTDNCGSMMRAVLSCQDRMIVNDVRPWTFIKLLDVNEQLDAIALANIWSCNDPYVLVVKNTASEIPGHWGEQDAEDQTIVQDIEHNSMLGGALLPKDFIRPKVEQEAINIPELPLRRVPIVQANCSIHKLTALLTVGRHPWAVIVAPLDPLLNLAIVHPEVVDITQHLQDVGTSMSQHLKFLGFVDYHALVARVLFEEATARESDDGKQPPDALLGLLTPPLTPRPSTPFAISNQLPELDGSVNNGVKRDDLNDYDEFKAEGFGDVPQRSVGLSALTTTTTTLPIIPEEEATSSTSTSELRRRRRPRGSLFDIFRSDPTDFLSGRGIEV